MLVFPEPFGPNKIVNGASSSSIGLDIALKPSILTEAMYGRDTSNTSIVKKNLCISRVIDSYAQPLERVIAGFGERLINLFENREIPHFKPLLYSV